MHNVHNLISTALNGGVEAGSYLLEEREDVVTVLVGGSHVGDCQGERGRAGDLTDRPCQTVYQAGALSHLHHVAHHRHFGPAVEVSLEVCRLVLHEVALGLAGVQGDLRGAGLHQVDKPGRVLVLLVVFRRQTVVAVEAVSSCAWNDRRSGAWDGALLRCVEDDPVTIP